MADKRLVDLGSRDDKSIVQRHATGWKTQDSIPDRGKGTVSPPKDPDRPWIQPVGG
jgi:hypothetical protein